MSKKRINHDNALERECIVREIWQDEGVPRIGNEEVKGVISRKCCSSTRPDMIEKKIKMVVKMKDYDQHMMDSSYCIKADPNSNVAVLKL